MKDETFHKLPNKDLGYTTKDGGDAGEGIVTADDGEKYTKSTTIYVICSNIQKNGDDLKMITYKTDKWVGASDKGVTADNLCGKLVIIMNY